MMPDLLVSTLDKALTSQGLNLSSITQKKLIEYLLLLHEWNAVHNLTGIQDLEVSLIKNILDSLSILPYLLGTHILDVGTGGGLPGIPLAIAEPSRQFVLLDSSQKKIQFVQYALIQLKLPNVSCICSRVESYKPNTLFDVVMSRAYASLSDFIETSEHCLQNEGKFFAMKGKQETLFQQSLPVGYTIQAVHPLKVAGLEEERCLVIIGHEQDLS